MATSKQERRFHTPKGGAKQMHGPGLKKKRMSKGSTKTMNQPIKSPGSAIETAY